MYKGIVETSLGKYLLENNLPEAPMSCEGEPAPDRVVPCILEEAPRPLDKPKGDLIAFAVGSPGEVLAVGEVDRWPAAPGAKLPIVK